MRFTPWIGLDILIIFLLTFGIIIAFNIANIYYLRKLDMNKWLALGISIAFVILSQVLSYKGAGLAATLPAFLIGIWFIVWFFDLHRNPKVKVNKNEKKIVMKPKAKPHRVKKVDEDKKKSN